MARTGTDFPEGWLIMMGHLTSPRAKKMVALGAGIGLVFGAAFKNPAVGLVLGAAAGVALAAAAKGR